MRGGAKIGTRTWLSLCLTGFAAIVVVAGLALLAAGCGATAAPEPLPQPLRAAAAPPPAHECDAAPGAITDLAAEPPLWREHTSGRTWTTTDGCVVRVDVVADYDGPEHCGFESARNLVLGHPVGTAYRTPRDAHVYVRDPQNAYGDATTAGRLDTRAELPAGAADTGLRLDTTQLWSVPGDPEWIWVATPGGPIERWPLDREPAMCA